MAAHLSKHQRELLLKWIGEGLETDEINKRAARCKPAFVVKRSLVNHYRKTREIELAELKNNGEHAALSSGLAVKAARLSRLDKLAEILWGNLTVDPDRLWQKDVKSIGSGEAAEVVEYETFNSALVREFRGLLDDISKEVGHRKSIVEVIDPESTMIAAIKAGKVDLETVAEEFGREWAVDLFRKAGKEIASPPEGAIEDRT